jgi:transcriptional regulator with XRE-family HTH domain
MKLYNLESFGKELKTLRLLRELSQKDVASYIGMSQDTLRRLENGYSIPKIETLDYLSILYKVDVSALLSKHRLTYGYLFDKELAKFNQVMITREQEEAHSVLENIELLLESEHSKPTDQLMKAKLQQFKNMVDFYTKYVINDLSKANPSDRINDVIDLLKISIPDFSIKTVHLHHYDYLEMRLLLLLSSLLRYASEFSDAKYVLFSLEENALLIKEFSEEVCEILLKTYFNLAYVYHRIDQHDKVIEACNKGIGLSKQSQDFSIMQHFLFRKAVAYYGANDQTNALKFFKQTLNFLELTENNAMYNHFESIIKNQYNIKLQVD